MMSRRNFRGIFGMMDFPFQQPERSPKSYTYKLKLTKILSFQGIDYRVTEQFLALCSFNEMHIG